MAHRELSLSQVLLPVFACALIIGCGSDDSASNSDSDTATAGTDTTPATTSTTGGTDTAGTTSATDASGSESNSATDSTTSTTSPTSGETDATSTTDSSTTAVTDGTTSAGTDSTTSAGTDTTDSTTSAGTTDTGVDTMGPECVQDSDCPGDFVCLNEMCQPPPPECVIDEDCGDPEKYCGDGKCIDKCKPGDMMGGGGMVEDSYIWVPSQDSGQVSKIDTLTLVELARYRTGAAGGTDSPSRTAVSADGRFVIVNNRGTGRVTAFAARLSDCVDRNNNGLIETSPNKDTVLAWGADECMIYTLVLPNWGGSWERGPRGVTWTVGTWNDDPNVCAFEDPKVWVGHHTNLANRTAHFVRLDGLTGTIEQTVAVQNWVGQGTFAPYGGALDPQQRPWFSALRGEIVRVNTDLDPITVDRWTAPSWVQSYGFTVDNQGNPWMAGCSGPVSTFDVKSQQWIAIPGVTNACHRGIAVDQDDHVWVASNSPCRVVQIDAKTRTLIGYHNLPQCSTVIGPSVDVENNVWMVDQSTRVWKIVDKNVPGAQLVNVAGSHYVYSDMTGGQVRGVIAQ
jgi:hypothetical protein